MNLTFDDPIPFEEAIAIAQRKGLLPTTLTSAEIADLSQQLKQRAVFSARMNSADVLQVLQENLEAIVSNLRDDRGVYRSIPEAKAQLREAMFDAGVRIAPVGTKPIKDFYSDTRRDLMIRTSVLDTLGFGQHVAAQDSAMLFTAPAQELVRFSEPKGGDAAKRDWIERWNAARDEAGEEGSTDPDEAGGRMVALKNHPIWQALGDGAGDYDDTLGNPWPPFAFNSGMGVIPVTRADAVALGIIEPHEEVKPDHSFDMNENLEASVAKFSDAIKDELNQGGLKIVKGILKIANARRAERNLQVRHLVATIFNSRVYERDSLGRFASEGTLSVRDNIRRGKNAVERALRSKRDVPHAMQVKGLGIVDFPWGRPGTNQMNEAGATHADGFGISHIQAKRGDDAVRKLPVVLAKGSVVPQGADPDKRLVKYRDWTAVVKRSNATRSFVVTHIDSAVRVKNSGRLPRRSIGLGQRWEPGCDPCPTQPALLFGKSGLGASNTLTVAQKVSGLKTLLGELKEAA